MAHYGTFASLAWNNESIWGSVSVASHILNIDATWTIAVSYTLRPLQNGKRGSCTCVVSHRGDLVSSEKRESLASAGNLRFLSRQARSLVTSLIEIFQFPDTKFISGKKCRTLQKSSSCRLNPQGTERLTVGQQRSRVIHKLPSLGAAFVQTS